MRTVRILIKDSCLDKSKNPSVFYGSETLFQDGRIPEEVCLEMDEPFYESSDESTIIDGLFVVGSRIEQMYFSRNSGECTSGRDLFIHPNDVLLLKNKEIS